MRREGRVIHLNGASGKQEIRWETTNSCMVQANKKSASTGSLLSKLKNQTSSNNYDSRVHVCLLFL